MSTSEGQHRWESLERKLERQDWDGMDTYGGKMMGILGEGCWGWSCQERGNGEGQKGGLWMWWKRIWLRLKWRRKIQLIETTGEGKSAVATPDGKSRKKKKNDLLDSTPPGHPDSMALTWNIIVCDSRNFSRKLGAYTLKLVFGTEKEKTQTHYTPPVSRPGELAEQS